MTTHETFLDELSCVRVMLGAQVLGLVLMSPDILVGDLGRNKDHGRGGRPRGVAGEGRRGLSQQRCHGTQPGG